jgi:hypothetical protein
MRAKKKPEKPAYFQQLNWSGWRDSNPRPLAPHACKPSGGGMESTTCIGSASQSCHMAAYGGQSFPAKFPHGWMA